MLIVRWHQILQTLPLEVLSILLVIDIKSIEICWQQVRSPEAVYDVLVAVSWHGEYL